MTDKSATPRTDDERLKSICDETNSGLLIGVLKGELLIAWRELAEAKRGLERQKFLTEQLSHVTELGNQLMQAEQRFAELEKAATRAYAFLTIGPDLNIVQPSANWELLKEITHQLKSAIEVNVEKLPNAALAAQEDGKK